MSSLWKAFHSQFEFILPSNDAHQGKSKDLFSYSHLSILIRNLNYKDLCTGKPRVLLICIECNESKWNHLKRSYIAFLSERTMEIYPYKSFECRAAAAVANFIVRSGAVAHSLSPKVILRYSCEIADRLLWSVAICFIHSNRQQHMIWWYVFRAVEKKKEICRNPTIFRERRKWKRKWLWVKEICMAA